MKCPSWLSPRMPSTFAPSSLCSIFVTSSVFVATQTGLLTNDWLRRLSEINKMNCKSTNLKMATQEYFWRLYSGKRLSLHFYYIWKKHKSRKNFEDNHKGKHHAKTPPNRGLNLMLSNKKSWYQSILSCLIATTETNKNLNFSHYHPCKETIRSDKSKQVEQWSSY